MTARQTAIAAIASHKVASTTGLPGARRRGDLRPVRVRRGRPAAVPRQADLPPAAPHDRRPRAVRPGDRRRGRARREGVGAGARRDPLHALVRADDRLDGGEARLVPEPDAARPRRSPSSPARTSSRASRTRRSFPSGGIRATFEARGYTAWDVTSADLPPGRAERRHADDPDRLRLVHRRGARPQDPAAPLAGRARASRRCASCAGSATRRRPRVHEHRPGAGVLPRRPPAGRAAARPRCSPAGRCSAPRRPRARSWRTSTSARSASGSSRS